MEVENPIPYPSRTMNTRAQTSEDSLEGYTSDEYVWTGKDSIRTNYRVTKSVD